MPRNGLHQRIPFAVTRRTPQLPSCRVPRTPSRANFRSRVSPAPPDWRKIVDLRFVDQQEERVQPFRSGLALRASRHTDKLPSSRARAIVRLVACAMFTQLRQFAEHDRFSGTRFGAGRLHAFFLTVVTERAFPGAAVVLATIDDAERAAGYAITTTVADVGLNVNRIELRANDGARGTAPGIRRARNVCRRRTSSATRKLPAVCPPRGHRAFHECDLTPGGSAQVAGVVVRHSREMEAVVGQLIPLLARDLAGFAADADRGVREEALALAMNS